MGQKGTSNRGGRKRDAAATRAAILEAGRVLFTRDGYDHVGMRDIAAVVGVDAALVVHYFGSKEGLFAEAVTGSFALSEDLLGGARGDLGERLARYVLKKKDDEFDPVLTLLRSAPNRRAADLLREGLDQQFVRPLSQWLGGEKAYERAGLIASNLFGLAFMSNVLHSKSLTGNEEDLISLVASTLQFYVDGTQL